MGNSTATSAGSRSLTLFVTTVTVVGIGVVAVVALAAGPSGLVGDHPRLYWLFLGLFTLAEARPLAWLRRDEGGEVTPSWTFAVALLFVAPAGGMLLGLALACLASDAVHRKPLVRGLFNAANYSLSLGMGALILYVFPGQRDALLAAQPDLEWFVVFLLTAAVVVMVNSVLTSAVLALVQNLPPWPAIRGGVSLNLATDGMLLALAPIFVVVARASLWFVPLLVLTTWAVYRSVELALARQHEATHDALTDLPNRRLFVEQVTSACRAAGERSQALAVVLLDIDHFDTINEHLGNAVGDRCLQEVADRLSAARRASDLVARIGGDEFAVLVTGLERSEPVTELAGRLLATLDDPCVVDGVPVAVPARVGIALYPEHGEDVDALLQHADHAVYMAKKGLSRVATYEPSSDQRRHNRWHLVAELPDAMARDELVLHYQPKLDVRTGRIAGCEALVRWQHPDLGIIPPVQFMPFAENTEFIQPLTEHILRMALSQCAAWRRDGLAFDIAVNASTRNLHDLRFPELVADLLADARLEPSWLELEITENTVMADPVRSTTVLAAIREQGVRIAVDDFGTGYSSLAHLRELPVDTVKIDRSFIMDMATNGDDLAIVRAIIELARNLGLDTVAEGIETVPSWEQLRELGCRYGQGYLVARPLPPVDLTAWAQSLPHGTWQPTSLSGQP